MKKYILNFCTILLISVFLFSCKKEDGFNDSPVTYFNRFQIVDAQTNQDWFLGPNGSGSPDSLHWLAKYPNGQFENTKVDYKVNNSEIYFAYQLGAGFNTYHDYNTQNTFTHFIYLNQFDTDTIVVKTEYYKNQDGWEALGKLSYYYNNRFMESFDLKNNPEIRSYFTQGYHNLDDSLAVIKLYKYPEGPR